jgi:predicted RNase H-like HicB family nuclease
MQQAAGTTAAEHRYSVIFEPAPEGGFVVHVPHLGITTEGETVEEARAMAIDAIEGYLECLREDGIAIPREPAQLGQQIFVEHLDITL